MLHCNGNSVYIFLFWELRCLSPNFHIHVSVSDLYIPRIGPHIPPVEKADPSWEYIIFSQTHECGNWDRGPDIPFLGIFVSNFRHFVFAVCHRTCIWMYSFLYWSVFYGIVITQLAYPFLRFRNVSCRGSIVHFCPHLAIWLHSLYSSFQ